MPSLRLATTGMFVFSLLLCLLAALAITMGFMHIPLSEVGSVLLAKLTLLAFAPRRH